MYRAIGLASRPRKVIPAQLPPSAIMRDYTKALRVFTAKVWTAFLPFIAELPYILESAHRARNDADEPARVRQAINRIEAAVSKAVTQEDIASIANKFAVATSTHQRKELGKQVKAALGIEAPFQDRKLAVLIDGFAAENAALIKGLTRETISAIEKAALKAVQDGKLWPDLKGELTSRFGMSERRAKLIARDQIGKLYGQINASRQKEIGITRFTWRCVNDPRVREEHQEWDGNVYDYDDPPDGELPGEPIQCRCSAEPVFDDILNAVSG